MGEGRGGRCCRRGNGRGRRVREGREGKRNGRGDERGC